MHFTVGVISGAYDMEDMLEKYSENDRHTFRNLEEEKEEMYNTETINMLRGEDGKLVFPWDSTAKKELGYKEVQVSFKEVYPTKQEFFDSYFGLDKNDEGEYGYWYNPYAQWDWYVIGGRWKGSLLIKEDVKEFTVGRPGVIHSREAGKEVEGYRWVDVAKIKDIEWGKMEEINRERLSKFWDEKHQDKERFFTGIKEGESKEDYLKRVVPFMTYSVLNGDGWYETEELTGEEYFQEFIKDEDPEKYFAVVDCHI